MMMIFIYWPLLLINYLQTAAAPPLARKQTGKRDYVFLRAQNVELRRDRLQIGATYMRVILMLLLPT